MSWAILDPSFIQMKKLASTPANPQKRRVRMFFDTSGVPYIVRSNGDLNALGGALWTPLDMNYYAFPGMPSLANGAGYPIKLLRIRCAHYASVVQSTYWVNGINYSAIYSYLNQDEAGSPGTLTVNDLGGRTTVATLGATALPSDSNAPHQSVWEGYVIDGDGTYDAQVYLKGAWTSGTGAANSHHMLHAGRINGVTNVSSMNFQGAGGANFTFYTYVAWFGLLGS